MPFRPVYFLEILRLRLNIQRQSRRLSQDGNGEPRLTAMCGGEAANENGRKSSNSNILRNANP